MGFNFYDEYYGQYIGIGIRKTVGKQWTYQILHGKQRKYRYTVVPNPRTASQQANRLKIRHAVLAWQDLNPIQQQNYRKKEPFTPKMSGYNFFLSKYLKNF